MKKKNISKKLVAVLLSIIMLAVSIPFSLVGSAAGVYDPAPKFSEAAQIEGARAWLDDEGNVNVTFPAADATQTYKGEDLSIAFYILELVDMGPKDAAHTDTVIDTIKVTGTSCAFAAADIGEIDLEANRYSVTVTAVDEENWFSLPLYTTVTDVPVAEIDASRFANFSTSATAVREIMTFEDGSDDGSVTQGSQLLYMGVAEEAGTEDLSDNVGDTSALRFIVNDQPTGTQAFDTSYSRQTWDFNGAEEMWYWMDLSKVELQGISFRLRTNEKMWIEWKSGKVDDIETVQRAGETVYSTKGTTAATYTGEAPYVYIQAEDGSWDKVMMTNGTVDLGHFKGYVRVPLKFICSETATYVDISNQEFNTGKSFTSGWNSTMNESNAFSWMSGMTFSSKVLVDNAGTSVSDALLIHRRGYKSSSGLIGTDKHTYTWNINGQYHSTSNVSSYDYSKVGYMLAMPLDPSAATTTVTTGNASTDRAYVSGTTVMNREAGLKAIEDIYNAGFAFENCSADSLQNSFFVDNIFFYRTDGGAYSENTLDGNVNTGNPMSTYYDEESAIARIIFDEIDKYIESPDWADYRELEYILELIAEYNAMYTAQGKDTTFLGLTRSPDTTGLAGMATKLNREGTWEKAWLAYEACATEGTIDATQADLKDWFISNGSKTELVPSIVKTMEKLPAPESIASVSDALRVEIVKLWQAYSLLNLGQLEMLGQEEEKELLEYFKLVENLDELDGDEFIVGQQLADYPYIIYNDFESNYELGDKGWQLEDNKDAYTTGFTSANGTVAGTSNLANDWRHLNSLVTYTTNGDTNITDKDYYGYVTTDGDKSQEAMDGKVNYNASWATITDNGYMHSQAATMDIDSSFTADNNDGVFHTISITRQGKNYTSYTEGEANNMGLDGLGNLSTENVSGDTSIGLSLIFYVDFTELESFYFTTNVFTKKADGSYVKARVNMGVALNDQTKIDDWKYFILDPNTGEWVINHTTSQWCFTSTKTDESWGDTLSLDGYKGYIMVPLYHIKVYENLTSDAKLDGNATWLNNIYAIQFCIGGANGTSLDEKSFTIDNVGFTYDPAGYPNVSNTSYADKFKAKSLAAKAFEDKVAEIDIYDDLETVKTLVAEATAMYEALPGYQKSATAQAKMLLGQYELYTKGMKTVPEEIISPEDLSTYVQSLPAELTGSSVTGENDIPYPGFTNGEVNYASMGIDKATAEQIIQYYDEGYSRFSRTQKANMANRDEFLAAYNMSMRLTSTLESIKNDAVAFLPLLTDLYEKKTDADGNTLGNFVSIAGRDDVQTFKDTNYDPLQYYSKTSIDDGSIYESLQNTSRGFTYFLNNTREFTVDGEEIQGGILTFHEKMNGIYKMANDHITNKTLFTDEEFQSIKDIIEEYNALLPAYYNVEELYDLEQAILALFPSTDSAISTTDLMLTPESTSLNTTYSVNYAEYLDLGDETTTMYVKLTTKSEKGVLTDGAGNEMGYMLKMGEFEVNASEINGLTDDAWMGTYPVANNTYTPGAPLEFVITASVTQEQIDVATLAGTATDEVIVEFLASDGTVFDTQTIYVSYSMGDTYMVTIPGSFPVEWDDSTPQDVSYSVTTEMVATSKLTVGVQSDGTGKMKATLDETLTLDYTTENFVETEFGNRVTDAKPDPVPTVTVSGWDNVPVGEYRTTLTYTVVYNNDSTS